jgi:hypothetical protein
LFQQIEMEPKETCLYRRVFWTWKDGLGTMFSEADIERMRLSAFFEREMEGAYGGIKGTTFRTELLQKCKVGDTWEEDSTKNKTEENTTKNKTQKKDTSN